MHVCVCVCLCLSVCVCVCMARQAFYKPVLPVSPKLRGASATRTRPAVLNTNAKLGAIIFGCDGVLVDSERDGHRVALNKAIAEVSHAERSVFMPWLAYARPCAIPCAPVMCDKSIFANSS
jgi:hypothetical protein